MMRVYLGIITALLLAGCSDAEHPVRYCAQNDLSRLQEVYLHCVDHIGGETALHSLEDVDLDDAIAECRRSAHHTVCQRFGWRTRRTGFVHRWLDHPTPERKK